MQLTDDKQNQEVGESLYIFSAPLQLYIKTQFLLTIFFIKTFHLLLHAYDSNLGETILNFVSLLLCLRVMSFGKK